MRLRTIIGLVGVAAGLAGVPAAPASAQCATSTFLEIDVPGVTRLYYDDRSGTPPVPGIAMGPEGTWVYEEANGAAGLQRGGMHWLLGDLDAEICGESDTPDRLWL